MTALPDNEEFRVIGGDCIEVMHGMPSACCDFCITSVPFPLLYAYTAEAGDIGNSENFRGDAKIHLSFFYKALARVMKPGRAIIVHVMQIPRLKRAGGQGLNDFRGLNIRLAERAGLVYCYDWLIQKNPQSQALRTKSRELQFAGLESDRARCRGALGDYLLKFAALGENAVSVDSKGDVSRNDWIKWAACAWDDIRETDTLNVQEARQERDTRHICPLQLSVYERCIRLFTNPNEVVLDPFAGIGSGGFVALGGTSPATGKRLQQSRRFLGIELNPPWRDLAERNCQRAIASRISQQRTLFDALTALPNGDGDGGAR